MNGAKQVQRIQEAQHAIEVAAAADYYADWAKRQNVTDTHKALRLAALELLAESYPELDVQVVTYPNSEYVDLEVVLKKT